MKTIIKDKAMMMEEVRTLISEGHTVSFTVKGNSMNPFMVHLRDKITLGPWKEADLKEGVVALVRDTRGNHLIHRSCCIFVGIWPQKGQVLNPFI